MTPLTYLGECENVRDAQDRRTMRGATHAFAWTRIDWKKSPQQLCMVAWVPGRAEAEYGVFPVYERDAPNLGGQTAWRWDGNLESPTLHPSLCLEVVRGGRPVEIAHGFITAGKWDSC